MAIALLRTLPLFWDNYACVFIASTRYCYFINVNCTSILQQ